MYIMVVMRGEKGISLIKEMEYKEQLESTKKYYPFARWRENFFPPKDEPELGGMEQYTQENCDKAQAVFDKLIEELIFVGQSVDEKDKVEIFKRAILSLNKLNDEVDGLIETGEREDLCELIDQISIAADMNPKNYGDGEGIADQWREW
jgi:hypothetical protein